MKTIAIIDDDIHIRDMLTEVLTRAGYAVLQGGRMDSLNDLGRDLDYYYFQPMPFMGIVISVFIAMFISTECPPKH